MKFYTEISVGEFIDRLSILKIKEMNKLDVTIELQNVNQQISNFPNEYFKFFENILLAINESLWEIENLKRTDIDKYSVFYSDLSTLTTNINDLRHLTKAQIDKFYHSEITEKKNHFDND
jgi:hypothetical protein